MPPDATPYDALLVVSFGGPEGLNDVIPFLENVTRGRGIPRERLAKVGEHYVRFGGISPINAQNAALVEALQTDFAVQGLELPVYWGNRNWSPYLPEALGRMADDGVRRAAVFVTSAYASYSGCRQYRENLADALAPLGGRAPRLDKLRHYFNVAGFVKPMIRNTLVAVHELPAPAREKAHLAFTTHSIPQVQAQASGPQGGAYVSQHLEVARLVAEGVRQETGVEHPWRLVYQSRSGPATQPWLEPDIVAHLEDVHGRGVPGVVMVPIGFISDHMEVKYDLDTQACEAADAMGLPATRAATVGTDAAFVAMIRELVLERAAAERQEQPARPSLGALGPSHDVCPAGCCPNPRGRRPAACQEEHRRR